MMDSNCYIRSHVHRDRPQPQLPPRDPPSPRLARGQTGAQENAGQPHRLALGEGRGTAPSAQGPPTHRPRGRLHGRTFPIARSCRSVAHRLPAPGTGAAHRREALPRARPGAGDGARTVASSRLEARHYPAVALHDPGRGARGRRRRRGRPVRGDGLAARTPGANRAALWQSAICTKANRCSPTCRQATTRAAPAR